MFFNELTSQTMKNDIDFLGIEQNFLSHSKELGWVMQK
ncbi:hypothetical protein RCH33_136 [Flavobacterium daejeonense]|nr:hypothetical protein RCH33_136 [Flavobacterium daejeonense]